ncbi:MAG: phosphatase PAP2 family protein [Oscillospiraceae bacterium]|nr:phosphatase PAP2 family protein [Oscillospiraceae bacterium]
MELLYLLESIRNPVLDAFFSLITYFGDETLFIVFGLLFFWCVDKTEGYYLLSVGLTGNVLNQFMKLIFRVPRPWVKDPDFTIVESAREGATGYSFPSGHTQTSVGVFGAVARWHKEKAIRAAGIVLCVLVPLSRMYLGVHTPADVGVSVVVALALVFGLYPLMKKAAAEPKLFRILFAAMTVLALGYLAFVNLYPFGAAVDADNLSHGTKNAYTLLGCILAVWFTYEVEGRYIRFETKAVWWAQILKLALGLGILMGIKAGLKAPLSALMKGSYLADGIRYFAMTAFAGCVWPLTFPFFAGLGRKK